MAFWRGLEFLFIVLVGLFSFTQLIWPLWVNRPLLPMFGRRAKVEKKVAEVLEERSLREMLRKLHTKKESK